jgi:putative FmdB family regulatory protein
MPIYEYRCQECQQIFEQWQKDFNEKEESCPVCGGPSQRLISNTSFVLKGSGWYASGYCKETSTAGGNGNGKKPQAAEQTKATPAKESTDASSSTAKSSTTSSSTAAE